MPLWSMMTSSNGNIFRVTGPLCGEFTGQRWIPRTKASDAELWFFLSAPWLSGWINNHEAGDMRHNRAHYDVIVWFMVQHQFIVEYTRTQTWKHWSNGLLGFMPLWSPTDCHIKCNVRSSSVRFAEKCRGNISFCCVWTWNMIWIWMQYWCFKIITRHVLFKYRYSSFDCYETFLSNSPRCCFRIWIIFIPKIWINLFRKFISTVVENRYICIWLLTWYSFDLLYMMNDAIYA